MAIAVYSDSQVIFLPEDRADTARLYQSIFDSSQVEQVDPPVGVRLNYVYRHTPASRAIQSASPGSQPAIKVADQSHPGMIPCKSGIPTNPIGLVENRTSVLGIDGPRQPVSRPVSSPKKVARRRPRVKVTRTMPELTGST